MERQQVAYNVFRGGFRDGHPNTPPHWDVLEPWIRDAIHVAYLQGQLDRIAPAPLLASASPESPGLAGGNAGQGSEFERGKDIGRAIGWDAAKRDTSEMLGLTPKRPSSEQYGPHRCWFPHKGGGEVLVTIEHEIRAIDRMCGYR